MYLSIWRRSIFYLPELLECATRVTFSSYYFMFAVSCNSGLYDRWALPLWTEWTSVVPVKKSSATIMISLQCTISPCPQIAVPLHYLNYSPSKDLAPKRQENLRFRNLKFKLKYNLVSLIKLTHELSLVRCYGQGAKGSRTSLARWGGAKSPF